VGPTRVLIVDGNAAMRAALSEIVDSASDLEVMALAANSAQAARCLAHATPDVIALAVDLLQVEGSAVLRQLLRNRSIPVVVSATRPQEQMKLLVEALAAGAVDVVAKPRLSAAGFVEDRAQDLCATLRAAAKARPSVATPKMPVEKRLSLAICRSSPPGCPPMKAAEHIVVVGASTGGPAALQAFLASLPKDCPPIVAAQHMPSTPIRTFANLLNSICKIDVKEAENGDHLRRGLALIAPSGLHTLVAGHGAHYFVELKDGPYVSRHKPSVDVLFRSTARAAGADAVGVILTGMGDDGALGLKEMRAAGARTIGQDEATSIVYGMPKAAFESGAVQQQAPLDQIAALVLKGR